MTPLVRSVIVLVGGLGVLALGLMLLRPQEKVVVGVPVQLERVDALPYDRTRVTLAGSDTEAYFRRTASGEQVSFMILVQGSVLDTERYVVRGGRFFLSEIAGTKFEPSMALLPSPVRVPSTLEWQGTLTSGSGKESATAVVNLERESLNLPGGPYDTVKADVQLTTMPPEGTGVHRKMAFWFVNGRGIVQRQVGDISTRGPL